MFLTEHHERQAPSSLCASGQRRALHGWERLNDRLTVHGQEPHRHATSLTEALDQIANLRSRLAAMQMEIDVLTEALDYARSIDC